MPAILSLWHLYKIAGMARSYKSATSLIFTSGFFCVLRNRQFM